MGTEKDVPMHIVMVLYPHPDDPEAFKKYYEETHIPLAAQLPGLRSYSVGYPQALGPDASPYFCVFRAEFDDAAAMQASFQSDIGQKVAADVPNYSPKGATMIHFPEVGRG
jgi:uncharacterized protein (TIGR02118 family)